MAHMLEPVEALSIHAPCCRITCCFATRIGKTLTAARDVDLSWKLAADLVQRIEARLREHYGGERH